MSGVLWMLLDSGALVLFRFVVLAVLARLLLPEEFGLASAVTIVLTIASVLGQAGLPAALIARKKLDDRARAAGVGLVILASFIVAASVFGLSGVLASALRIEDLAQPLAVFAWILPVHGLAALGEALLQREFSFRKLTGLRAVAYLVGYAAVAIGLALAGWGAWALIAGFAGEAVIKLVALLWIHGRTMRPAFDRAASGSLLHYGGGFTLAQIATFTASEGDNLVVGRVIGTEALGLYSRAYQLMAMPAMVLGRVLSSVLFPTLSKIQDEPEQLTRVYRKSLTFSAYITLPAAGFAFFCAPEIIVTVLGPDWTEAIPPFQILALGTFFRTSYKMSDSLSNAMGTVYRRAWRQWLYAIAVVGAAVVAAPWGVSAVATGILGALALNFVLTSHLGATVSGMSLGDFVAAHVRPVVAAVITSAATFGASAGIRPLHWPAPLAFTAILAAFVAAAGLVAALPVFRGDDERWMLELVRDRFRKRD
jgi:PST family polysaccharide transporter